MKKTIKKTNQFRLNALTYLNIAIQIALPLAVAFSPNLTKAESNKHFIQNNFKQYLKTNPYILTTGEDANSIAKKFNMTPEALRKLNQFRTFSDGFDNLKAGDELDVPEAALPAPQWENSTDETDDIHTRKLASLASLGGGTLANAPGAEGVNAMARGIATSEASGQLQKWLNHFGTARVQLDADENFSLKNSQFDLLIPLYDHDTNMLFAEGSLHRTDDRTQSNLGLGVRHFTPTYMLGGNMFTDYDLSRDHARMGFGVEYWRNFLKIGINGYQRLTGWKNSPDTEDYEERPANGWDIRTQTWLPTLPQLGGKLIYEQYYGKDVGLFSKDNRQQNPHALTAGVTYTPIPLLTISAEQRQGESGKNDTRVGIDMTYQLGEPWKNQVNPDAVAAMRTLAGSRYDLVERNNNIILEYRKKNVIQLHTVGTVIGHPGDHKSLGVSINSQHSVDSVEWSASSLESAGGSIEKTGVSEYSVVLPIWNSPEQGGNIYTISGVAVDSKGNRSNQSTTQVTVQAPEINGVKSTFTATSSLLEANGIDKTEVMLNIMDSQNQPMDIAVSDITLNITAGTSATVTPAVRRSPGVYMVSVTAGTKAETVTVTPVVNGVKLQSAEIVISNLKFDTKSSTFSVGNPKPEPGQETELTLVASDADGDYVGGLENKIKFIAESLKVLPVHLTKSSGSGPVNSLAVGEIKEVSKGYYRATLQGAIEGEYKITPVVDGTVIDGLEQKISIKFKGENEPVQAESSIAIEHGIAGSNAYQLSNNTYKIGDNIQVTVTLNDVHGHPISGRPDLLALAVAGRVVEVPNAIEPLWTDWKDIGGGRYTRHYKAKYAGSNLKATLQLSTWGQEAESNSYGIMK